MEARDQRQLRYLSIAYYVVGLLGLASTCLPGGCCCCFGFGLLSGELSREPDAEVGGALTIGASSLGFVLGLVVSAAMLFNGYLLANRTGYLACFVLAVLTTLFMPLGTVLGVLTLIVLMRDSVRREFGQ